MSISLDLYLYIRDKNIELPLSLQGFIYSMAFYVGSNAIAWVSQEEISNHLGIALRTVRHNVKLASETKLLIIERNPINKSKNVYRFADFLINYHQSRSVDNFPGNKMHRQKIAGVSIEHRQKIAGNIGNRLPMSNQQDSQKTRASSNVADEELRPKGTYKGSLKAKVKGTPPVDNSKSKAKSENQKLPIWTNKTFLFSDTDYQASKMQNFHLQLCFNKFIAYITEKQGHDKFTIPEWEAWRAKEKNMDKGRCSYADGFEKRNDGPKGIGDFL